VLHLSIAEATLAFLQKEENDKDSEWQKHYLRSYYDGSMFRMVLFIIYKVL